MSRAKWWTEYIRPDLAALSPAQRHAWAEEVLRLSKERQERTREEWRRMYISPRNGEKRRKRPGMKSKAALLKMFSDLEDLMQALLIVFSGVSSGAKYGGLYRQEADEFIQRVLTDHKGRRGV